MGWHLVSPLFKWGNLTLIIRLSLFVSRAKLLSGQLVDFDTMVDQLGAQIYWEHQQILKVGLINALIGDLSWISTTHPIWALQRNQNHPSDRVVTIGPTGYRYPNCMKSTCWNYHRRSQNRWCTGYLESHLPVTRIHHYFNQSCSLSSIMKGELNLMRMKFWIFAM